jgi:hypothetical protein
MDLYWEATLRPAFAVSTASWVMAMARKMDTPHVNRPGAAPPLVRTPHVRAGTAR